MSKVLPVLALSGLALCSFACSDDSTTPAASAAPGAALKCTSGKDAFDTYGTAAFVAVNEAIVANVFTELGANNTANLGDSFTKIGSGVPPSTTDPAATFKGKLAAFLVYAYGGPTSITYTDGVSYSGLQDMASAHAGLAITDSQFQYFVSNIVVPALTSSGVTTADVTACFAPVLLSPTFQASIVGK
ncbi:MAG TPA: hypothetical protein VH328_03585 [Burkholderiaceae bacterium]|jgi:hypothetical protein|nr:hypothetical protein [Burkholderiaceae bacterium]